MTDVKYIGGNPVCDVTARAALAEKADSKTVGQTFFTALMRLSDDENLISGLDARVTALEAGGGGDVPDADTTRY